MVREANWKDRILCAVGTLRAYRVQGDSMLPALRNGDVVLISPRAAIVAGDVVLANHPYKESVKMLKRLVEIDQSGRCVLAGDNAGESTDSRTFGTIPMDQILGKAVCRVNKTQEVD